MSTEQHQIEQIEQLVQRSNNVVIWTDIPLFTSPFFRESYCLYLFWNSSRSKNCVLVVKKNTWLCSIQCYTQNETIPPKKVKNKSGKLFIWILALSREGCDARFDTPVMWWGWNIASGFLDKINLFFFYIFNIYVCVFCGERGCICMISICTQYSDWIGLSLWMPIGRYGLYIFVFLSIINSGWWIVKPKGSCKETKIVCVAHWSQEML